MSNKRVFFPIESKNDIPLVIAGETFTNAWTAKELAENDSRFKLICGYLKDSNGDVVQGKFLQMEIAQADPLPSAEFENHITSEPYELDAQEYTDVYLPNGGSTSLWGQIPIKKPHW
ncbi:hypothetical protein VF04_33945 [Nostoc linckia z7]|uniref:Uncharacterized protein n=1 Tax=Nostoc linckia z7 TaxID=1628745 RepID=A0ABX4KCG5_NOSLI|nr:hypothetical protein [Nostoc linckia]PHJ59319.1 hypothetical protein VF05_32530 [Nostoc linckia z3]PHJ63644.1 hypothetical protein VF03_30040 [Nostoc linckia z2]PHJ70255.1 hypothetical protein VF06_37710 [Nostoc linckia z4]PHJ88144.1 hypothetical protein VF04_33945 [Nostoc linckia z7]